jgi:1,4-alpha-glucan branching enzyme
VEILNSDSAEFGGSNALVGDVTTDDIRWDDLEYSAALKLPPLGVLWLAHEPETNMSAAPGTATVV